MPIYVSPGQTFEAAAQNLIPNLEGTVRVGIWDKPTGGTAVYGPSTAGITEDPTGSGFYGKSNFVAPATGGQYWLIWDSGAGTSPAPDELVVAYTNPVVVEGPTFASLADVEARLGRELSEAVEDQVEFLLLAATEIITDVVGKDREWAQGLDVPATLRFVCAEVVCRSLNAAPGVSGTTETLGQYSVTERLSAPADGGGLWLTEVERLMVRRTVWGSTTATPKMGSVYDDDIVSTVWPSDTVAWE